jgi:trehalose-phosphatase
VETTVLKIHNINAVVLALHELMPDPETIRGWKNKGMDISIICDDELNAEKLSRELESLTVNISIMKGVKGNNKSKSILKEKIKRKGVGLKKTIFVSDHPPLISKMKPSGMALSAGLCRRGNSKKAFYDSGASIVVNDIENIIIKKDQGGSPQFSQNIPDIFKNFDHFTTSLDNKKPVFFFDYDGTLTPIINDPGKAYISKKKKKLLQKLSSSHNVAIVSGRDMMDIRSFIGLDSLIYAGSHGFRISGPDGLYMTQEKAVDFLPGLDRMENELVNSLEKEIPGVSIERKHFAIAIHYRNAPPGSSVTVNEYADRLLARNKDFKKGRGKKIVEIKPSLDWHKGKAVEWIMERLGLSFPDEYLPMYIGDDITDEDAFRTLSDNGMGILVSSHGQLSAARYHLRDVDEVGKFLDYLVSSPFI